MAKLGSTITENCEAIETGVPFRMFDMQCTNILKLPDPYPSSFKGFVPKNSQKAAYESYLLGNKIEVCNVDYAKKHTLLRMSIKLPLKCPYEGNSALALRLELTYTERTNPSNAVSKNVIVNTQMSGASFNQTLTATLDGNPFSDRFPTSGEGSLDFAVEIDNLDDPNPCTNAVIRVTLSNPIYGVVPNTVIDFHTHLDSTSCPLSPFPILVGNDAWVSSYFGGGPIGLVMSFSANLNITGVIP